MNLTKIVFAEMDFDDPSKKEIIASYQNCFITDIPTIPRLDEYVTIDNTTYVINNVHYNYDEETIYVICIKRGKGS